MNVKGLAVLDPASTLGRERQEGVLDRGAVVLPFTPKAIPTASSSGTVVDDMPSAFQARDPSYGLGTAEAVAFEAFSVWSKAVTSQAHDWVSAANELARANLAGLRVHVSAEALANAVNEFRLLGYPTPDVSATTLQLGETAGGWLDLLAVSPVNVDRTIEYRRAAAKLNRSRERVLSDFRRRLDGKTATYVQREPRDVVVTLTRDGGIGQLLIAKAVGVTPTAVRKWRRGETARPEYRRRLAQFAALIELLDEAGVHDPGGWLSIPVSSESTVSPVDLYLAGRSDLVLLLAHRLDEPYAVLDAFNPDWRAVFGIDEEYEVIEMADGSRSAVPRR